MLNPEGVNCLRFFEGRGYPGLGRAHRSLRPGVEVRQRAALLRFLERSIDKGTQWAVFEPNGRRCGQRPPTIEDFLFNEWKSGACWAQARGGVLRALRPHDDDPERPRQRPLICLIGVAPLRPAEFVIFRIGQKTLDFKR